MNEKYRHTTQLLALFIIFEILFINPIIGQYQSADNYYENGNLSYYNNDFENSIRYFNLAFRGYEQEKDVDGMIKALGKLGLSYSELDNHTQALDYLLKAESLANENDKFSPELYNNIGWEYLLLKDYSNSEKYLKMAYDFQDYFVDYNEHLTLFMNLGFLYRETGRYDLSKSIFQNVKLNIEQTNIGPIDLVNEEIRFLDAITAENKTFKEDTIIYFSEGKIFAFSNFTTNFNYKLSNVYYFNSVPPTIPEYINESEPFVFIDFSLMVTDMNKYSISKNISDSDIIIQSVPFPNAVVGEPRIVGSGYEESVMVGITPENLKSINLDNYEKYVKIIGTDRYIGTGLFYGEPDIQFLENITIVHWNYSSINTPLQRMGMEGFTNRTETTLISTGNILILIKPESKKHWSKEIVRIREPIEYDSAPIEFGIIRHDTRFPLKPLIPIPLLLDTKSDSLIDYVKLGKTELEGPIHLQEDTILEENKYYTSEGAENTTLIVFNKNTTNSIDVELKYMRDVSNHVQPLDKYKWEYTIPYFYQVGDIPDYKQTYVFILPKNYQFVNYPTTASISRTDDGLQQISIEYKDSPRFRYINFTIEKLEKSDLEKAFDWLVEQILNHVIGIIILIIVTMIFYVFHHKKNIRDSFISALEKHLGKGK